MFKMTYKNSAFVNIITRLRRQAGRLSSWLVPAWLPAFPLSKALLCSISRSLPFSDPIFLSVQIKDQHHLDYDLLAGPAWGALATILSWSGGSKTTTFIQPFFRCAATQHVIIFLVLSKSWTYKTYWFSTKPNLVWQTIGTQPNQTNLD